jgi:hypothetical protein
VVGPPTGGRSNWHFTLAAELGRRVPSFVPQQVVPAVFSRTAAVANVRTVLAGGSTVRVNAGPPTRLMAATLGRELRPVALSQVAPHALPRSAVVARLGAPVATRPWVAASRAAVIAPTQHPMAVSRSTSPLYANPPVYHVAPARPMTSYPAPATYPPRSVAPAPYRGSYGAPSYGAYRAPTAYAPPSRSYAAPSYAAPAYRASVPYAPPSYRAAPTYSAPLRAQPTYAAPAVSRPAVQYSAPAPSASHHSFGGRR